jgi:hypothetical protein
MNPSEVLRKITAALDHTGIAYMLTGSLASALANNWKVDLIFRKSRGFSQEEFRRRRSMNVEGIPVSVASAEDVVLAKLEWSKLAGSQRQIEDVAAILRLQWSRLDQNYLERWIAELNVQREWEQAKSAARLAER